MKKLVYLIVAIVALGLIVSGCLPVVPPAEQGELGNLEMISVSKNAGITIDGILSTGEWDAYFLGTSVTGFSGGMSVDVYGFADDTYLYAAYVADINEPGWSGSAWACISCNLYYKTPQSAVWPDPGSTILGFGGDGIGQTDGNGWNFDSFGGWGVQLGEWVNEGIEFYVGDQCYNTVPNPNVVEVKIPLSLLTYAGDDGQIMLTGQYWQYDWATPFLVALPQPTHGHWVNNQRVPLYKVTTCSSNNVSSDSQIQGEVVFVDPMGNVTLVIQGNVEGLTPKHEYAVWVRNLSGYTGPYLDEYTPLGYYKLETFTTNVKGKGKFHINILADDLPTGEYEIQLAINDDGCTVLATEAPPNWIIVTIKGQE